MAKARRAKKKRPVEIVDFVAAVDRTALSYGRSHHHLKWEKVRPNKRALHLYGRMLLPRSIEGLEFEAALYGDAGLVEELDSVDTRSVALLQKRGDTVQVTARVPPDFVVALSAAYHDGRLGLCVGRGPPTLRGTSLLINIDFEDRVQFESYWGEPLPVAGS